LMVNAEKWGAKLEKRRAMPTCYRLTLCVATFVFPTFSVFEVACHEHTFAFSVMSVMPHSQERILGWPAHPLPRLHQKVLQTLHRLTEYDDVTRSPLFSLASGSQPKGPHC